MLRTDASLLPAAVDEVLRRWTPVMVFRRAAAPDVELGGVRIRAGDEVVVSSTSADPLAGPPPDRPRIGA